MELIADILLVAGALGAAFYCMVLSRRLRRFNNLENGMGGAIAVLSAQVDDMTRALEGARSSASDSSSTLVALTDRAEGVSQRLELLVASLHDLPVAEAPSAAPQTPAPVPTAQAKAPAPKVQTEAPAPVPVPPKPARATESDKAAPLAFVRSGRTQDPLVLGSREQVQQ